NPNGRGVWTRIIAPALATIGLTMIFILILFNFDLMIEAEAGSALIYILPGLVIGAGVLGLVWGQIIQNRRPEDYERMRYQDQLSDDEEIAIAEGTLNDPR